MIKLALTGRKVLPGDEVAIAEEYMSGEGTYEMEGKIYASAVGELDLDQADDDRIRHAIAERFLVFFEAVIPEGQDGD